MIDFVRALELVKEKYPEMKVFRAGKVTNGWIFSFKGKNGKDIQIAPIYVSGIDGEIKAFFPPDHKDELEHYTEIQF